MGTPDDDKAIENISEQEREHAVAALAEFNQKNYAGCLQNILKLENRQQDFKVMLNKYVAEYYKSDLRKTDQFHKNLNALLTQFHLHIDKLDDVDHCVIYFNQALIHFHKKNYSEALRIMDCVYKFIEPMDEALGRQVGLLLIELYLCVKQIDKATNLITYLNNHALNQATPTILNTTKVSMKNKVVEKEKKVQPISKSTEIFLKHLDKYRLRCNLLNRIVDYKFDLSEKNAEILFLAANQEYLLGNYQEAIKHLTSIAIDSIKYTESGESSTVMFYNNMGAVHHAMGKPNLAGYYYQQAVKEEMNHVKQMSGDVSLHMLGASKYHELMYNLGIAMLHAGKALQAFECLIIAVRRYHRNSRLWLRLAECCMQVHKTSNMSDFDIQKKQKEIVVQILGSKETQKVVLTTNLSKDKKYSSESQSYAVPVANLEFASLCLKNAKLLLPSDATTSPVSLLLIPGLTPVSPNTDPGPAPSSPLDFKGKAQLKNSILAASAYVSLCLGDYIVALENAKELLAQPKISGAHKLLGHLYAAEALVLLNKLPEALEQLNPENIKDISIDFDEKNEREGQIKSNPPTNWFPNNLKSALAVMQYNIAVVKTLRGQLDQANVLLKQIWQGKSGECKVPAQIIMLDYYYRRRVSGHADVARTLIKQYCFQQRFSG